MSAKSSMAKTLLTATLISSIASPPPQAHAGWLGYAASGVGGFLLGRMTANRGGGGSGSTSNVYIDMSPVAQAIRDSGHEVSQAIKDSGHEVAQAIRTQPDHTYTSDDQKMFNDHYHLDQFGNAIGVDLGSAEVRKFIRDKGKIAFQEHLESRLANLQIDTVLAIDVARAFRGQPAAREVDLDQGAQSTAPFRANALINLIDWARQNPGAAIPEILLKEPLFDNASRGNVTREQEIAAAKLIASVAGEAAKSSRGFGKVSYTSLMQKESTRSAVLENAGDWHLAFSKVLNTRAESVESTLTYCKDQLKTDMSEARSYLREASAYTGGKAPTAPDTRKLGEVVRGARAVGKLDDLFAEAQIRGAVATVLQSAKNWESRCESAQSERVGGQIVAEAVVRQNAHDMFRPEIAKPGEEIASQRTKTLESELLPVAPTEFATPNSSSAR